MSREAQWRQRRPVAVPLHWRAWDDHVAKGPTLQQAAPPGERRAGASASPVGTGGSPAGVGFVAELGVTGLGATKAAAGAPVVCGGPAAAAGTGSCGGGGRGTGGGGGGGGTPVLPRAPLQHQPEPHAAAARPRSVLKTSSIANGALSAATIPSVAIQHRLG